MHGITAVVDCAQIGPQSIREARWSIFWYALRVRVGYEHRVCVWLRQRALEPYWPRFNATPRAYQPRHKIIWRSVLPGWMFVRSMPGLTNFGMFDQWPVARFVRHADHAPIQIPDLGKEGIEQIRKIEASLNDSAIAAREGIPFKVGDLVTITKLEIVGKIVRLDGRRRIVVSAPMFGSIVDMTVCVADIESV
jgi:hypothetical protein